MLKTWVTRENLPQDFAVGWGQWVCSQKRGAPGPQSPAPTFHSMPQCLHSGALVHPVMNGAEAAVFIRLAVAQAWGREVATGLGSKV